MTKFQRHLSSGRRTPTVLPALLAAALLLPPGAGADDRDLVRASSNAPYVQVLFDTTGSMLRTPEGVNARLLDDDPQSKLYQAKQALDIVLQETSGVNFGFATFPNFTRPQALAKQCSGACIGRYGVGRTDARLNRNGWCTGWEPNGDDLEDIAAGYRITWPTTVNSSGLETGDLLPLDWANDNVQNIRQRLAPNLALGETDPDYGIARYFNDQPGVPPLPDSTGIPSGGGDAACATGADSLVISRGDDRTYVDWDITNGATQKRITSIAISWPGDEAGLRRIYFGGSEIWEGDREDSPATINSGWSSSSARDIAPGATKTLRFRFNDDEMSTSQSRYSITVTFDDGCEVKFPTGASGSTCATGSAALDYDDQQVSWTLANTSASSIYITAINLVWPGGNGDLTQVYLDGSTIYTPDRSPTEALIDRDWYGWSYSRRQLDAGESAPLTFRFANNASDNPADYSIQVTFNTGCQVSFDSTASGPGSTVCAVGDQGFEFRGNSFLWLVQNNASTPLTVFQMAMIWPGLNGPMDNMYLNDLLIYQGPNNPPSALFPDPTKGEDFIVPPEQRQIASGDLAVFEFEFQKPVFQDISNYQLRIDFLEGCSVVFQAGTDTGGLGGAEANFLRLVDERARPFMGMGNTPLEQTLRDFGAWYQAWRPVAEGEDPDLASGCRDVYVILLTDGYETCGGQPVTAAADLLGNQGIRTYVIGFAIRNPELDAIAAAGGTGQAYSADNQEELIDALSTILLEIEKRSRTFASAAVPSVSASAGAQIHITSFSPVDEVSVWPGRLDSYNRPIPLTTNADGKTVPDRSEKNWDAGEQMLTQAPVQADIDAGDYKVGAGVAQRRVFYAMERPADTVPATRKYFLPPTLAAEQLDLYGAAGMGFDSASATFLADGQNVIAQTLRQKQAQILDPITITATNISYVLGDIFHSDPIVVGPPDNFAYFTADMEGRNEPCGARLDGEPDPHLPYPCFALEQRYRRKVLLVGSNDGAVHAFDAGQPSLNAEDQVEYGVGTGKEIFAFIPREVLPSLKEMAQGSTHTYTVDGPITVADVINDSIHSPGNPAAQQDRHWRTVALGGLREGGKSYYALDITMPDTLDEDGLPEASTYVPNCIDGGADCKAELTVTGFGPFPARAYPLLLWELTDGWDEDNNGLLDPDLAYTWSKPNVGRIRVLNASGEVIEKYVAVFGGGMDPGFKRQPVDGAGNPTPRSGNYLYMVDIESGDIIYKRRLDRVGGLTWPAMVPSEPAAVDTDFDSYLDTIYIGTTAGHLFKVDISEPQAIVSTTVNDYADVDPISGLPPRRRTTERITASAWDPFPIFSTGGRPIYYPPSVIFISELSSYALAFGTGDREDLWNDTGQEGRFYLFLDGGFTASTPNLPFTESKLEPIALASVDTSEDLLFDLPFDPTQVEAQNPGWFLALSVDERVVNKSFSISGVVFFSTYQPDAEPPEDAICASTGVTNLFAVAANNANGLLGSESDDGLTPSQRYRSVADFLTTPFVEAGQSDDTLPEDPSQPPGDGDDPCQGMGQVTQMMQQNLFPGNCSFANYTLDVKTIRSETGIECIAPLPICVVERNWKEF